MRFLNLLFASSCAFFIRARGAEVFELFTITTLLGMLPYAYSTSLVASSQIYYVTPGEDKDIVLDGYVFFLFLKTLSSVCFSSRIRSLFFLHTPSGSHFPENLERREKYHTRLWIQFQTEIYIIHHIISVLTDMSTLNEEKRLRARLMYNARAYLFYIHIPAIE